MFMDSEALILVSACLLGVACRYDGQSIPHQETCGLAAQGLVVSICPEVAGGLPTPRLAAEIENAYAGLDGDAVLEGRTRVIQVDGADVTAQFLSGAEAALALAQKLGIRRAILKARSPSCGAGQTYDGRFAGTVVPGDGVTAALCKRAGIHVITELELAEAESSRE
jgi:uncharacterized protein YbbK (DUF523 family)